jgi:hypothetical protein
MTLHTRIKRLKYRTFIGLFFLALAVVGSAAANADDPSTPPPGPPPGHHHPQLTAEQKACMESKLGKPGEGERPSKDQIMAALEACHVPKPPHPPRPHMSGAPADSNGASSGANSNR